MSRTLLRRQDFEDEMAEEVRFHLEQYAEDLVRGGLSPEEAASRTASSPAAPLPCSRPDQVSAQFLSLSLRLLAAGVVLGVLGAWIAGRAMQALLFQVPALHARILAGTAAILGVVCLAARLLPSRRAARISPTEALAE